MQKPKMAIQLYTLRDHIKTAEDFDSTLSRLQNMGVRDVQISAIGDIPAETQRDILQKHGMQVCVTHKSFDWMLEAPQDVIEHHRIIGCSAIGIGAAPNDARYNTRTVRAFIEKAQRVGKLFRESGMQFHYHNHAFEFHRLDDHMGCMMDLLLNETDPELFWFIPDLAWIRYGGQDPAEFLYKMRGRVKVVHFKDYVFDKDGYRKFVSLGRGVVDLKACYQAVCELGIPFIAYEQDCDWTDGDPFKSTEESWAFLQSL
ncbi:MAG: sugar phosphate isomerase/epimerase [Clostridia bacterium]|nr:sugar phosphate isomerase/epimerase [Clostridia bacterium]